MSSLSKFCERFPEYVLQVRDWPVKKCTTPLSPTWGETLRLTNVQLLYIFGLGDGSAYGQLREWLHQHPRRKIVFWEEDPAIVAGLLEANVQPGTDLFDDKQVDFALFTPDTIDRFAKKYPSLGVEMVCLPEYRSARFHRYKLALLRKTALSSALFIDRLHAGELFANFVQNVPRFQGAFYANGLKNIFAGMTAIVCGAGPSLQDVMETLRGLEGKAVIIAGGSAIAALSQAGIEPHIAIAIDPNPEEFDRFKNSFFFEGPVVLSTRVCPDIFATCNGPFGYLRSGTGGGAELWLEEQLGLAGPKITEHMPEESMSVTTLALALAVHMGCTTIALSGVDLAYTGGNRYAGGVCAEKTSLHPADFKKNAPDQIVRRKDKRGKSVVTAIRWVMEAAAIAQFAKHHSRIRWINATAGGLPIAGLEEGSLDEAVLGQKSFDIRGKLALEIARNPMPTIAGNILQPLQESLMRTVSHLKVLANIRPGSKALAEFELQEELAVQVLFYDMQELISQVQRLEGTECGWKFYLDLVKNYSPSH